MAHMLQKPVFALPGCQPISVNTFLCDTLGLAESWRLGWQLAKKEKNGQRAQSSKDVQRLRFCRPGRKSISDLRPKSKSAESWFKAAKFLTFGWEHADLLEAPQPKDSKSLESD